MEVARAGGTAGLARDVLERAQRRAAGAPPLSADEDRERLGTAFASIVKLLRGVSKECELYLVLTVTDKKNISETRDILDLFGPAIKKKYYGAMATNMCKENEIQHFCKYHGKSVERKMHSTEGKRTEGSRKRSKAQTCQQSPRRSSKDFYIEVSPGTYSVTAISEDMVEQTHIVDVNAGQSIDVTFVL